MVCISVSKSKERESERMRKCEMKSEKCVFVCG